uniref:hypothetical protein n=1 Tax=Acutalibacter muris TaxID=1796620 RepID=UPI00272DEBEE
THTGGQLTARIAAALCVAKLRELCENEERLSLYTKVLYDQALLVEGTPLEDPAEFARQVSAIIV